jgi:hypothetical protein
VTPRFGLGEVLSTSIAIWARNLPRLIAIAALWYAPLAAWTYAQHSRRWWPDLLAFYELVGELPAALRPLAEGENLVFALATAGIVHAIHAALTGRRPRIGASLRATVRRAIAVIAASFALTLATMSSLIAISGLVNRPPDVLEGWIAWWITYVVLGSLWFTTIASVVLERRGPLAAMRRSLALAAGHRIKLFVIVFLVYAVFVGVFVLGATVIAPRLYESGWSIPRSRALYDFGMLGVSLIATTLTATVSSVCYERLRAVHEGPAPGELSAVFD